MLPLFAEALERTDPEGRCLLTPSLTVPCSEPGHRAVVVIRVRLLAAVAELGGRYAALNFFHDDKIRRLERDSQSDRLGRF